MLVLIVIFLSSFSFALEYEPPFNIETLLNTDYLPDEVPLGCEVRDCDVLRLIVWADSDVPPLYTKSISTKLARIKNSGIEAFFFKNTDIISYVGSLVAYGVAFIASQASVDKLTECEKPNGILVQGYKFLDYDSFNDFIDCQRSANDVQEYYSYVAVVGAVAAVTTGQSLYSFFSTKYTKSRNDIQDGLKELEKTYLSMAKALLRVYQQKIAVIIIDAKKQGDNIYIVDALVSLLKNKTARELDLLIADLNNPKVPKITFEQISRVLDKLNLVEFGLTNAHKKCIKSVKPFKEIRGLLTSLDAHEYFLKRIVNNAERIVDDLYVDHYLEHEGLM